MMKTYKDIERAREVRLWLRDIIAPVVGGLLIFPEFRQWTVQQYYKVKFKLQNLFAKRA